MKKVFFQTVGVVISLILTLGNFYNIHASSAPVPLTADAKTYFVDGNNIGGSGCDDTWPGTLTEPLCTIDNGIALLLPGDTLYVRGGVYPSFRLVTISGTAGNYITISGYNNELPHINGGEGIKLLGTTYVMIKGFEVTGATGNSTAGITVSNSGSVNPAYNIIEGNKVHDNIFTNMSGIRIEEGSYNSVIYNEVYNNYFVGIRISGNSSAMIGNEIGWNITYNHTLAGGDSDGIDLYGAGITQTYIHDNIMYGNSDDGLDTWNSSENIIVGNVAYNHNGPGDGNGFKLGGPAPGGNNLIKNNIAYNNKLNGFHSNESGGNFYYNNVAYDNGGYGFEDGLRMDSSCTVGSCAGTFINNIGYNNTKGNFSAAEFTAVSHNNLWYSDSGSPDVAYNYKNYSTLTEFYSASGNRLDNPNAGDYSSFEVNPQFVNAAGAQFNLLSSSPAIDHGDPNNPAGVIAVNRVDIGAMEYGLTTFADVPADYWAASYIERLYNAGITGGCNSSPLLYCPIATVTRAQMAIFILRGIHGSSYVPPTASGAVFGDVPLDSFGAAWIERFSFEGITAGCGNGLYCPNANVTRAQMAIFLLKGTHGSSYIPPSATGIFPDVPAASFAADWIEQLALEGITGGCGGGNYCPDANVTRDQMAVFLVRAFNLP